MESFSKRVKPRAAQLKFDVPMGASYNLSIGVELPHSVQANSVIDEKLVPLLTDARFRDIVLSTFAPARVVIILCKRRSLLFNQSPPHLHEDTFAVAARFERGSWLLSADGCNVRRDASTDEVFKDVTRALVCPFLTSPNSEKQPLRNQAAKWLYDQEVSIPLESFSILLSSVTKGNLLSDNCQMCKLDSHISRMVVLRGAPQGNSNDASAAD